MVHIVSKLYLRRLEKSERPHEHQTEIFNFVLNLVKTTSISFFSCTSELKTNLIPPTLCVITQSHCGVA